MRVVLSSHHHSRLKPSRRFLTLQTRKINWLRKKRGRQNPASEVADWDMLQPARRRRFNMSPGALGAGGRSQTCISIGEYSQAWEPGKRGTEDAKHHHTLPAMGRWQPKGWHDSRVLGHDEGQ